MECLRQLDYIHWRVFNHWLKLEIEGLDCMPSPNAFLQNTGDPQAVTRKQRELSPLYKSLHELIRARIAENGIP